MTPIYAKIADTAPALIICDLRIATLFVINFEYFWNWYAIMPQQKNQKSNIAIERIPARSITNSGPATKVTPDFVERIITEAIIT